MNGALIGFGTIGLGHLHAYETLSPDQLKIKAIVDTCHQRRNFARTRYSDVKVYSSIEDLWANDTLNIEFIDICTPPDSHLEYIHQALEHGVHVLCEKPFLLSQHDYDGLLSAIYNAQCFVYPSHNYRFAPIIQFTQEIVRHENFGQIISAHFRTLRTGHAVGVPEWKPHWRRHANVSGGGILRDHGPHSIYVASQLIGRMPKAVSCLLGNFRQDEYQDTEDTVFLSLDFGNDVRFDLDLSWCAGFRKSYYALYGTQENIIIENDNLIHAMHTGDCIKKSIHSDFDDSSHKSWFVDMLNDFCIAIGNNERQKIAIQEALLTTIVIELAYQSSERGGQQIEIPSEIFDI